MAQFAVVKVTLDTADAPEPNALDRKAMAAFLDRLRAKFRVVAIPLTVASEDGYTSFAYTSLAHSHESLSKQLDSIAAFTEDQGFGRISDESVLMDDVDSIGDDDDDAGEDDGHHH
jgi:hypothetical protein